MTLFHHIISPSSILIPSSPTLSPPPPLPSHCSLTVAQWTGGLLLADGLLQAVDDTVFVPEALAVGSTQGFHLPAMLHAVSLQLHPILVSLVLQLLEMGILLQKSQQVGHHRHQGRL